MNFSIEFLLKSFFSLSFFNSTILSCDKAKFLIKASMNLPINDEYKIWGIWYQKFYLPLSSYILCIVSSLKNRALIVKSKLKEKKNKNIFIILEL